jgi:cyclopropane fatty-acyl-phospholipid synthase-like methyltransferase
VSDRLTELYCHDFFEPYSATAGSYADSCRLIAEEIHRRFEPQTVVDWGCGAGLHLRAMAARGARVLGVDGSRAAVELASECTETVCADLTEPVDLPWDRYDLAMCIDVLEHVHEQHADAVLANLVAGADMVILSCAPPNQGGHHHVNEQPRRYWVRKMAALGWEYQRAETSDMERYFLSIRDRIQHTWMFHNLCIYLPVRAGRRGSQVFMPPGSSA